MYRFAKDSAVVFVDGQRVHVGKGDIFHAADPCVAAHPWLFSDEAVEVKSTPGWKAPKGDRPVEQATAAPGERRGVRRT